LERIKKDGFIDVKKSSGKSFTQAYLTLRDLK
jgi:hypothetical protein